MTRAQTAGRGKQRSPLLPTSATAFLERAARRLAGGALIAVFGAVALALVSYHAGDPSLNNATRAAPQNWLGQPGAYAADFLLQTLGVAAVALILPLATWGWRIASLRGLPWIWTHIMMVPLACLCWAIAAAAMPPGAGWPIEAGYGGFLGQFGLRQLETVLAGLAIIAPLWAYGVVFGLGGLAAVAASLGVTRPEWAAVWAVSGRGARTVAAGIRHLFKARPSAGARPRRPRREPAPAKRPAAASKRVKSPAKPKEGRRAARERQRSLDLGDAAGFKLPTLNLLARPQHAGGQTLGGDALEQNARMLESVLEDFSIRGEILQVKPGPVVTLYELEPAPGTKSSRVIGLADDIARSMSAVSARVAVVPGRNVLGIELPNSTRETVYLREILASDAYEQNSARLPLALGNDISGAPVIADLASMPHLLVAGTTGSGKSVGLNAMILSLLYRLPPDRCKFIMVDPKMLELSIYDDIPNLLSPVVTEPKKAVVALKWAVREMEERYRAMSKLGVRSIGAYNKKVGEAVARGETLKRQVQTGFDRETGQPIYESQEFDLQPLPLIVIVIDEMADLMLVAGKDVEAMVQRLSQMARAAGIHLIMATQRPSVDVITGTIKANFPTRIGYQVTSKIDSRTILGEQGAEQLLGQGDMLYMAGGGRITRVHGPFVSDGEVEKVVAHLKRQGAPEYVSSVTEEPEEGYDSPFIPDGESSGNALYDQAVDIVQRDRRVSTSYIQRRLKIGYNKAASLVEEMESNGVISAPNHAGKREVLTPEREDDY